jgi:hypothetical protein
MPLDREWVPARADVMIQKVLLGVAMKAKPPLFEEANQTWSLEPNPTQTSDQRPASRTIMRATLHGGITIALWMIQLLTFGTNLAQGKVDFTRDIQPILVQKCYACHGPDDVVREADLRLDQRDSALAILPSGATAIVPREPVRSAVVQRIFSDDHSLRMPPATTRKPLTDRERELLRDWIAEGAQYQLHGSFQPVRRPQIPTASFPDWQRNPIDAFIGKRLQQVGLTPSEPANRTSLIRRLSFDLRGLPPTIAEVDAFAADQSPDAYEKLVRRFLASEHFGEKLAIDWLDLARYGDTNGYHLDSHREVWLYRDWVIDAFNTNMPFNQFVEEQIAGDLMPDATDEQQIASGFHRNAPFNEEGGVDPDEFSVVYAVDRANTTGQALLGLTFGCAQCHSHKYDPISQKEYYEFYAFFNSVEGEPGGGGENGHHGIPVPPTMVATSPLRLKQIQRLTENSDLQLEHLENRLKQLTNRDSSFRQGLLKWAEDINTSAKNRELTITDGLVLHLDAADVDADGKPDMDQHPEVERIVTQWKDRSKHNRIAKVIGEPRWVRDGFQDQHPAVLFDGEHDFARTLDGGRLLDDGYTIVAAVTFGEKSDHQMLVIWGNEERGQRRALWRTAGGNPTLSFNGYASDVLGDQPLLPGVGQVAFVFQKKGQKQISLELNGKPGGTGAPLLADYSNESITIGANNAGAEKSEAAVGEILIYDRALSVEERSSVGAYLSTKFSVDTAYEAVPKHVARLLEIDSEKWTLSDWTIVARHYLTSVRPDLQPELRRDYEVLSGLEDQIQQLKAETTTMVMREMKDRKPAFILVRGDFQQPGERVRPNVPSILGRLPDDQPQTRLELARWLTHPDHPLVSRVRVNHLWKMIMGTGLVKTAGDFGTQGELPSHPDLLDWLAHRFVQQGWDTKALIFEIVTSATYQQQSTFKARTLRIDPRNRWLSQAPRFRLTAEEIRDMALVSSGRLNPVIGGPSVRPFQPPNYFSANSGQSWTPDTGDLSRRRSLYTYLQRTAPFPAHLIFDAPSRQICSAIRPRTNTPLQALATMNDPHFVESAAALALKTIELKTSTVEEKVHFLFRSVLSRLPTETECKVLVETYHEQLQVYEADSEAAEGLLHSASTEASAHPTPMVAAWTNVASVVLNLDEAITRE